jgi:hypothetical protein
VRPSAGVPHRHCDLEVAVFARPDADLTRVVEDAGEVAQLLFTNEDTDRHVDENRLES